MNFRFAIFLLFCLSVLSSDAQYRKSIPGYLGSKNAFAISVMPNIVSTATLFDLNQIPPLGLLYERAISRRGSLSFCLGLSSGVINMDAYKGFSYNRNNKLRVMVNGISRALEEMDGRLSYKYQYYSVAKSYYMLRSGAIAPQGKYIKSGLTLYRYQIVRDDMSYRIYDGFKFETYTNPNGQFRQLLSGSFLLEFGAKRFLGKHVFYQKAIAVNIPFNFWESSQGKTYYNIDEYNEANLGLHLSKIQTFNLSLSIGMAF